MDQFSGRLHYILSKIKNRKIVESYIQGPEVSPLSETQHIHRVRPISALSTRNLYLKPTT